jgi:hapalindole biogenesis HpiC1 cyclase-like protein
MKCYVVRLMVLLPMVLCTVNPVWSVSIPIENASFEMPMVDPNAFPALPVVEGWTEFDVDTLSSSNTGVFANTPEGSEDRMLNADGKQLAFLGSEQGNGLAQDLAATYSVGYAYRLTVGVGVSWRFPPSGVEPADGLELVLYYIDEGESVDIVWRTVGTTGLTSRLLQDVSVDLPVVQSGDLWAGKPIGIAFRAAGLPGGFWDLDNVRLGEFLRIEDSAPMIEE